MLRKVTEEKAKFPYLKCLISIIFTSFKSSIDEDRTLISRDLLEVEYSTNSPVAEAYFVTEKNGLGMRSRWLGYVLDTNMID